MERAIKTVAQTLITLWLADGVFNLLVVDWAQTLGVALGAGAISVLTSLASAQSGDKNSASLVVETKEVK